jgi:hypothetical protein
MQCGSAIRRNDDGEENNKLVNLENEGDSSIGKKPECLIHKLATALNPMSFPAFHTSTCSMCKLCSIFKEQ